MVVDTSIKITKATREKLYFLKGPDRDYNAVIEDLIEEHYSRPCSCQNSTAELVAELKTRYELCPVVDDMGEPVCMFVTTRKSLVTELCKRDGVESSDIECADGIVKTIVIHGWKE